MDEALHGLRTAVSRREVMKAGGVAAAGAVGVGLIPGNRVIIGASLDVYPKLLADAPRATGLRMYVDQENEFPDGRSPIRARG